MSEEKETAEAGETVPGPADTLNDRTSVRPIENELSQCFVDYAMSVIVQRALPDVRDGLKPVHRRILYAMLEASLTPTRPYKKSATVVGDVLGKYHPHGDSAVYESMVRMVQEFSLRYPLVDGQGNFGSIDGDNAAAYRYTEAKLTGIAMEMLRDIDKGTVDFTPNFDDRLEEPTVLPGKFPNLLVNGSTGIAVGMATNIPPHNLRETCAAAIHLLHNPTATIADLMQHLSGPDFPTGGIICGTAGIAEMYQTGRGYIVVRARTHIEEMKDGRERIIVTEIPYQVNKADLIAKIVEKVKEKAITDIADLRDESSREGIRIVIELKRDAISQMVLNQLFKHTRLQSSFPAMMLALVDRQPRMLNLRDILTHFLDHRDTVIIRRTRHDLEEALAAEHILEGLKIAVDNIDEVVQIIRSSHEVDAAQAALIARFLLSERQAKAILEMRLSRLTGLQIEELEKQLSELRATIADCREILASAERRREIVENDLREMTEKFGDERRSAIGPAVSGDFRMEDLIADEEVVVTVSHGGYIKRVSSDTYRTQRRGGRGISSMDTKEEDWVEHVFVARTHDDMVFFTKDGSAYRLKVYDIPQASRASRGRPIVNLLAIDPKKKFASFVAVREYSEDRFVLFATRNGVVKKTRLSRFANIRGNGIIAMNIGEGDEMIGARVTDGTAEVMLATSLGMAIRFSESDIRPSGRASLGVRGIRLMPKDHVVGMAPATAGSSLLVVTNKGFGKRTDVSLYRLTRRGCRGVRNMRITDKTGRVVEIREVREGQEIMLMTKQGVLTRQRVAGIREIGRTTMGVKLMNIEKGDSITDVALIAESEEDTAAQADETAEVVASGDEAPEEAVLAS